MGVLNIRAVFSGFDNLKGITLMENSNIKISTALFQDVLCFLENLPFTELERDLRKQYKNVYLEFKRKQYNITLRNFYALVVAAKSDEDRKAALSDYLNEKQLSEQSLSRLSAKLDSSPPSYAGLHLRIHK